MSNIKLAEIRKKNIVTLIENYPDQKSFGSACQLSPSQLSQILSGKDAVGNKVARRIEDANQLPQGWLDVAHEKGKINVNDNDMETIIESAIAVLRRLEENKINLSSLNDAKLNQMLTTAAKNSLYNGDMLNLERQFTLLNAKSFTTH